MSVYYRKKDVSAAQFSFAANYVWRLAYPMAVSEEDGFFFAKVQIKELSLIHILRQGECEAAL